MTDAAAVHAGWSQGPHRLRFPYGISLAHDTLAVANTLCWSYGICLHRRTCHQGSSGPREAAAGLWLAVADSGNNRVMLWQREGD